MWPFKTKQIESEEYKKLKKEIDLMKIDIDVMQVSWEMYKKKIKASKGVGKPEETETENINNPVCVPT